MVSLHAASEIFEVHFYEASRKTLKRVSIKDGLKSHFFIHLRY